MKKFLDSTLLILFFAALASNFTPLNLHEAFGFAFAALIVAHNLLNRHFYKNFARGNLNPRRIINNFHILLFAVAIFILIVSGAALDNYFSAPNANWLSIHLAAAIFSTILLLIHIILHAKRYVKGKIFYATTILAFILAFGAIFGLPYVDRWFHTVKVNRDAITGEKLDLNGKILIVYFSRVGNTNFPAEVDAVSGASIMLDDKKIIGNAQMIAEITQNITGGDIFALQTEKIYPADYSQTVNIAKNEFSTNELPALVKLPNVADYDKIILIYPLWWSDLPKPVENFLRNSDLSGKKLYPIVTHGGGGLGNSIETLKNYTLAEISEPLDVYSSDILSSRKIIYDWLKE